MTTKSKVWLSSTEAAKRIEAHWTPGTLCTFLKIRKHIDPDISYGERIFTRKAVFTGVEIKFVDNLFSENFEITEDCLKLLTADNDEMKYELDKEVWLQSEFDKLDEEKVKKIELLEALRFSIEKDYE